MKKAVNFIIFALIFVIFAEMTSAAVVNGTCVDSDKSVNYNEKGDVEGNWLTNRTEYIFTFDECKEDEKTLIEYYCDENFLYSVKHKCPNFCQDGACVKELIAKSEVSIVEENNTLVSSNNTNVTLNENLNLTAVDKNNTEENESKSIEENKSAPKNTFVEVSEENSNEKGNESFFKKIINWFRGFFSKKE